MKKSIAFLQLKRLEKEETIDTALFRAEKLKKYYAGKQFSRKPEPENAPSSLGIQ